MADSKLYKAYSDLPSWSKGVISVTALAVLVLAGYGIYKKFSKDTEEKGDKEMLNDISDEISKLLKKYKPSFAKSEYLSYADSIHNSLKYCVGDSYGTAEDILKRMKNDLDVALLIKAFGVRQDYCFGIPVDNHPLFTFVRKELGNEWGGLTEYRVNSINKNWKQKGITYQI